ncbi:hypothetical protein H0H93_008788, partial [Arthromyces matolae]
ADEIPKPILITYNITLFSHEQMKIPKTRREPNARFLEAESNLEWVDFRAQLYVQISNALFPDVVAPDFSKLDIKFSIVRHAPLPLPLVSANDYNHLLKMVSKCKTDPSVRIHVIETQPQTLNKKKDPMAKENRAPDRTEQEPPRKKAKTSKAPKESDILPANMALNDRIKRLRDKWECNVSSCHSEHCFVPAVGPHVPLSHEMFEKWAAAWLRDESLASIDTPPNIALFDDAAPHALAKKSPILQARVNNMMKNAAAPPSSAPVVNVVMPNDMFNFLRPAATAPAPVPLHEAALPAVPLASKTLLPPNCFPGLRLDMTQFCQAYRLSDQILKKFQDHAYTGTHAFRYIEMSDLNAMGFLPGEIVDLREAVAEWADPGDDRDYH